jgi:2-oxoglutarate dehydrogenase E1 component
VYATDVARMIQAPIFHVNGDDPEQCARVAQLAFEYRQAFNKDVVIDMICYRRRGHNESDNPSFTQPLMYDLIDAKRSVRKLYTEALIGRGDISVEEAEQALRDYQEQLERAFSETREAINQPPQDSFTKPDTERIPVDHAGVPSAISDETVKRILDSQLNLPEGFTVHPRVQPLLQKRAQMVRTTRSTGRPVRCSPSARCSSTAARCASSARTPAGAPSASGTPCCSTARPAMSTPRSSSSARAPRSSTCTTRC